MAFVIQADVPGGMAASITVEGRTETFEIARGWIKGGHTGVKVIGDGRIYLPTEFERVEKELKTATELELLALEIVRRMQGCGHVKAVSVTSDPHHGWVINGSMPGRASNSDVARAIVVALIDLRERYNLARDDKQ
jgi:hypothetical protein